jgi:hypothetical protein
VIGVALDHYVNLTRASERAMQHTRGIRRATAILDRVARDLENTMLVVKEPEMDPLDHPWLFYGESRHSEAGADHLKFVTRGHRPRRSEAHESDLEVVAYTLRQGEEDGFELMRWSSPRLPERLDRELPGDESEGAVLLSDGLATFGVQFIDEFGERSSSWDSSQLLDSSELPVAVDVELALFDPDGDPEAEPELYRRRVVLPVRPLDMEELLNPDSLVSGGSGEEDGGDEEESDEDATGEGSAACAKTPCARMSACDAINCQGKLGVYEHSVNLLIEHTIRADPSFCAWRNTIGKHSVRWLIDNPACR